MQDHQYNNTADKVFSVVSETVMPSWCKEESHWTSRLVAYLWPWNDCGCCLFFRGVTIGACLGGVVGVLFAKII